MALRSVLARTTNRTFEDKERAMGGHHKKDKSHAKHSAAGGGASNIRSRSVIRTLQAGVLLIVGALLIVGVVWLFV
jgi:hypothetical protein